MIHSLDCGYDRLSTLVMSSMGATPLVHQTVVKAVVGYPPTGRVGREGTEEEEEEGEERRKRWNEGIMRIRNGVKEMGMWPMAGVDGTVKVVAVAWL